MANKLILRSKNSPFSGAFTDIKKGSVLSHGELDNNFIYLKGNIIHTATTSGTVVTFNKIGGDTFDVDLSGVVNTADTYITGMTFDNSSYDLNIFRNDGVQFTNNLTALASDRVVTGGTYDEVLGVATYTTNSGNTFQVSGFTTEFTGNTSGSCINELWVSNIYGCSPITVHDNIQHNSSTASGLLSIAFGSGNTASGAASHVEGGINDSGGSVTSEPNIASGSSAHAEGINTIAGGLSSHAEGRGTLASGLSSHAEGSLTEVSGLASHAQGNSTLASGLSSHAEGSLTEASGNYSHAEGNTTIASGLQSHAEGNSTLASGSASHAEGDSTTASGTYSHAEGWGNVASGGGAHVEGGVEISRIGFSNSPNIASGLSSHAEGTSTEASGDSSHAEGNNTEASGDYSHAEGNSTLASGDAAHAEGLSTLAFGHRSHAEGLSTTASGSASHAEGSLTEASGIYSHAEGRYTEANGNSSHAGGFGFTATDKPIADGFSSFVHQRVNNGSGILGAKADYSAILGGQDNEITSGATNSVILGGNGITATTSNTVYVNKLNINTLNGSAINVGLGLDVNGMVVSGDTIDATLASNGLTKTGDTIILGGPLTGNTDIQMHGTGSTDTFSISNMSGTTKFFQINGEGDVYTPKGVLNLIMGENAARNYTAAGSVILGNNAGQNLVGTGSTPFGTAGNANVLIGANAGLSFTDGTKNIAIGANAMRGNSADKSITIGYAAGNLINTLERSTLVGSDVSKNTGSVIDSIIIGDQAALVQVDTSYPDSISNSIILGDDTKVFGSNVLNQIIIGDGAEGLGNNKTVIGNINMTDIHLSADTSHVNSLNIGSVITGSSSTEVLVRESNGIVNTTPISTFAHQKYAASIAFTGGTLQTVTHNLNDEDVIVQMKDSTGELITPDVVNNYQTNSVDIRVSNTETYRVIIIG